jgi:outer membrane lipoprotein-sorting protein
MKPEQDDKWLETMIRRAVGSEDAQFDAVSWKKKFRQEVESFESGNTHTAAAACRGWRSWRSIMNKRSSKIAASAAVAAGLILAVTLYVTGGGSTVAMAAVLEQLQTKCYEFEISVSTGDGAALSGKGMVLEPGKMRLEHTSDVRLGPVTSIIDSDAGQSLILFERSKAAYRFDRKEAKALEVFDFLLLPMQSIEDIWGLKAGNETALGRRDIDGQAAEGFRVAREGEEYTQTITVWADAKTGHPMEVEISRQTTEGEKGELVLSDFRVVPESSAALFRMEVPQGYTLAGSQTLDQLGAESATANSTTESTSAQAKIVLDAFASWADGNEQEAVELLVTVDWTDDFRFGQEHHFLTMSEREFGSLVSADMERVATDINTHVRQCRDIFRELRDLGRKAHASNDVAQAEKCFSTAVGLGRLLNRDTDMMLLVRVVGIAIQKGALTELSSLYEKQGETEKLRNTQVQISQVEAQREQINQVEAQREQIRSGM